MPITPDERSVLVAKAVEAKSRAYSPYSKFRVGACLLTFDDKYVIGANIENASFPVGVCAERTALVTAVTAGHKKFKALAVATDVSPPASPCGMCRQTLREFCHLEFEIIMCDKNGECKTATMNEILPDSFGPDNLPPPGAAQ